MYRRVSRPPSGWQITAANVVLAEISSERYWECVVWICGFHDVVVGGCTAFRVGLFSREPHDKLPIQPFQWVGAEVGAEVKAQAKAQILLKLRGYAGCLRPEACLSLRERPSPHARPTEILLEADSR